MSNWNAPPPRPDDPIRPEDRGGLRFALLLSGAVVLGLLFLGGVFLWLVRATGGRTPPGGLWDESLDEKYAEVSAAFNREPLGADEVRLGPIRSLFDGIVAATGTLDHAAFVEHVEVERFFVEMQRSGAMQPPSPYERSGALRWVRQWLSVPMEWDRYDLVHVELHANGEEAEVYGYFWCGPVTEWKVRWWLVRGSQGWKAYDWDILEYGLRASKEEALCYEYQEDPQLARYFQVGELLATADALIDEGGFEEAASHLRRAESLVVLPELKNDASLQIANAWMRCGRTEEALAAYGRVTEPEASPGTLLGLAICHRNLGRRTTALELASRYEALLGSGPDVNRIKGNLLMAMGRLDEAAAEFRKSLKVDRNNLEVLKSLAGSLGDDEKDVVAECIACTDDPRGTAESLAESFEVHDVVAGVEAMGRLLAKIAPGTATAAYVAGLAEEIEGNFAQAARRFHTALTDETDADKREQYLGRYLSAMVSAGRCVEGYLSAPEPTAAFRHIVEWHGPPDDEISEETLAALLKEHEKKQPEDPRIHYCRGMMLAGEKNYDEAQAEFAAGMAKTDDEDLLQSLRYQRIWAMYHAGRTLEAYGTIEPADETFRDLAEYYEFDSSPGRIAELESLVKAHRARCPDDPWLDYYAAVVEQQAKQFELADRLLARGCQRVTEEYEKSTFRDRRLDLRIETGEFLTALEEVAPAEETFAYLARHFAAHSRWPQLESLIERYGQIDATSPTLRYWKAALLWQKDDYEGIVRLLSPWP
ncbi:MAG: tetratricopeptide repeat protein, partial [Planctomycetota bacterium]